MIMATGVVGFRPVESVANVLAALHSTTHNGFPIAFASEGADSGVARHRQNGSHTNLVSFMQLTDGRSMTPEAPTSPTPLSPAVLHAEQLTSAAGAAAPANGAEKADPAPPPAAIGGATGTVMTVEGGRLEGVILRSQLLVLLQRRHFCDQHGRPVGREYSEKEEIDLEVS